MFGVLFFFFKVDIIVFEKLDVWRDLRLRLNSIDIVFGR